MAKAVGAEIGFAIKIAVAWLTAVACGAGDGVLLTGMGLKKTRPPLKDNSLGRAFTHDVDLGLIKAEGDIEAFLRYDGLDLLMALAMGATGGAPTQQEATAAYAQTFTLAANLDGLFATLVGENNVNVDEYPSVKLLGFTLKGKVGEPLTITLHCLADDKVVDSAVNTSATFGNVTIPETRNRALFNQSVFRMNDQSDIALAVGDKILPSEFELTYKRSLAGVNTADGTDKIDEPSTTGQPEVTLKLKFPRYEDEQGFLDWDAGTLKKMDLICTGGLIEGAYYRKFTINFPALQYVDVAKPYEEGIIPWDAEFICREAAAAPAGMTGITLPFQVDVINQKTTDVLA